LVGRLASASFLGSILGLAATATTLRQGVLLLLFYSLGMGLPFLLLGLGVDQASRVLKWLKPHLGKIEVGTGVIMMLVGVMISFNWLVYLNRLYHSLHSLVTRRTRRGDQHYGTAERGSHNREAALVHR